MIKKVLFHLFPVVLIKGSSLFDKAWYSKTYNIKERNSAKHYLKKGWAEGYNPSVVFNTVEYLNMYPDVSFCPLLHYEVFGRKEARLLHRITPAANGNIVIDYNHEMFVKGIRKNYQKNKTDIKHFLDSMEMYGNEVCYGESFHNSKNVILISHELSMTGAPIALSYMADAFKDLNYNVIVFSWVNGPLLRTYIEKGYNTVIAKNDYAFDILDQWFDSFDIGVCNTFACTDIINRLRGRKTPVLWWVHESYFYYDTNNFDRLPECLEDNIHIFGPGKRCKDALLKNRPNFSMNNLLYAIPDIVSSEKK